MADDLHPVAPKSILELSAFNPAARDNPHPLNKALRETCPVMRDESAKVWMLSRYEDVRAIVNDRTMVRHPAHAEEGSLSRRFVEENGETRAQSILFLDDPDHSRIRQPLAKAFYARVSRMRAGIEAMIDSVIDAAPASGTFDLMEKIAVPIPILVIARILGVDEHQLPAFRDWSEGVILGLNPVRTGEETAYMERSSEALTAYFLDLIAARRASPQDDLVSDLVALQASGEANISDQEMRTNLQALLVGGNLTTTDLIGNGVWLFLTHPDQIEALKAEPPLAAQAVEEVLRYEAPVLSTSRILAEDRAMGGCPMKASQPLWMSLASANRDPGVFNDPERFDITQKRAGHVAFGGGAHICIGAPLARIEARHVYLKLFARYPALKLPPQDLVWRALPFFRGLERLIVEA